MALCRGLDVSSRHYEFSLITGNYDGSPPEVKMPYEMPDNAVRSLLSQYVHVTSVHRRKYAFAPTIETGIRIYLRYLFLHLFRLDNTVYLFLCYMRGNHLDATAVDRKSTRSETVPNRKAIGGVMFVVQGITFISTMSEVHRRFSSVGSS